MGLLDNPDTLQQLGMAFGLLNAKRGDNWPALLTQAAAQRTAQQNQERQNRANDLQQLQGAYSMLKQQEFAKMLQARQNGQPYSPNPMLPQMEAKLAELTGLGNLSGKLAPAAAVPPVQMPQGQMPQGLQGLSPQAPQMPQQGMSQAPQRAQMPQAAQALQAPQQDASGLGGPAGGVPMEAWLAQDPTGKAYLEQLAKDHAPIPGRAGAPIWERNPATGKLEMGAYAPKLAEGMQPTLGPTGRVASADLIPNYLQGIAAVKSAESGAGAAGRLPFEKPDVVNTPGAPRLMTPRQQIESATGQDPLSVSPATQTGRNSSQLAILLNERRNATDPKDIQALDTEIQALSRAQASGQPFNSTRPAGLTLQDQGAGAAQRELGTKVGGMAGDVFTNGAASVQGKRMLAGMSDMAASYDPGKFQPLRSQLAQYATGLGIPEDTANRILATNTGDIQGLTSAAIAMAGKLTRQTDAQPSQLQFLKTLESMPMADRTPQGFARIMDYLNSMHDYNIDKMIALQQHLGKNQGDPSGFEAEWAAKSRDMPFVWNKAKAQTSAPANLQKNMTATYKAKQAIAQGKDPAAVKQRLIEQGYDPSGL